MLCKKIKILSQTNFVNKQTKNNKAVKNQNNKNHTLSINQIKSKLQFYFAFKQNLKVVKADSVNFKILPLLLSVKNLCKIG